MTEHFGELLPPARLMLTPGPSNMDPRVYRALATPLVGHMDPWFTEMMGDVQVMLRRVFQTQNRITYPISASGSGGIEASVMNLLEGGDECIICSNGWFSERMAVIATGGYGRGLLAPGSDIDLLFLLPYKQTARGESVAEALLYCLWDMGQKVGHATRSVEECIRRAKADMTIRTSLLEARRLFGDAKLYDELTARYDKEVVQGTAAEFVAAKLAEREERHRRVGQSRYLVEPNVKDGKGGLRDLHTLFWIAKYVYRVREPEELIKRGVFDRSEYQMFRRCEDFLWSVRCNMHFLAGRAEERLSFDVQRDIAVRLGYTEHPGLKDVERFMKHYFLTAKDVVLDTRYAAPAYGLPSDGTLEAIRLCARQEGMLTDPVYEGKSMHGMIEMVRRGEFAAGSKVLYAHLGGVPALNA